MDRQRFDVENPSRQDPYPLTTVPVTVTQTRSIRM